MSIDLFSCLWVSFHVHKSLFTLVHALKFDLFVKQVSVHVYPGHFAYLYLGLCLHTSVCYHHGACITARFVEDETRNAELNGNRNSEWWGDFIQLVKIEKIKFLGISRYKVELRF